MSEAETQAWTMESFLVWEELQSFKWEFDGVRPVAMTGVTIGHEIIQGNIIRAFNNRLAGGPCRALGPNLKIKTDATIRYPDVAVTCSPLVGSDRFFPSPVVIFEVLSDSTARRDRTTKLAEYKAIPSVRRYIMLEQDSVFATVLTNGEHGWQHALMGRGGVLAMPELGIEVPMTELYDGSTFDEPSLSDEP